MIQKPRLFAVGMTRRNLLWGFISLVLVLVIAAGAYQFFKGQNLIGANDVCIRYQKAPVNGKNGAFSREICTLSLEKVNTDASRERGLSGRPSLPSNRGMLFVFDKVERQCIWMKDMKFSLDIIWLNARGDVIKIVENTSPATYPSQFCSDDALFVIEVGAGTAKASGLAIGSHINL